MSHRVFTSSSIVLLVTAMAFGQAGPAGQAKKYTPPRMPDGHPDLQGFWTNNTYTPLERPKGIDRDFFTKEEALELERKASAEETEQTAPGTVADVHYDFTQFALDRNQSAHAVNLRTSMVVD